MKWYRVKSNFIIIFLLFVVLVGCADDTCAPLEHEWEDISYYISEICNNAHIYPSTDAPKLTDFVILINRKYEEVDPLEDKWKISSYQVPGFKAEYINHAEILVCITESRKKVGVYKQTGVQGLVARGEGTPAYQLSWSVRLIQVSDKQRIASQTLLGEDPPEKIQSPHSGYGKPPIDDLNDWLLTLINQQDTTILSESDYRPKDIVYAPDGVSIASMESLSSDISIWDIETGEREHILLGLPNAHSVAFSPDSRLIAAAGHNSATVWDSNGEATYVPNDFFIGIWETSSGEIVFNIDGHSGLIRDISFSPDGSLLTSASMDKTVKVWDISTGHEILNLEGHKKPVNSVTFSPDGKYIASGSGDKKVIVWDAATGDIIHTLRGHRDSITDIGFSPDGKYLASGSRAEHKIRIWDTDQWKSLEKIMYYADSLTFSPDGKLLAWVDCNHTVQLWDTEKLIYTYTPTLIRGTRLSFSPNKPNVATVIDGTIRLWNIDEMK